MELETVQAWLDAYVQAWRTNDPEDARRLFAEDAAYYTNPFAEPVKGVDEIVRWWTVDPDPEGSWQCDYRALAVDAHLGVGRGWTKYLDETRSSVDREYANIFVVEFDDEGRCTEFTEWFMKRKS